MIEIIEKPNRECYRCGCKFSFDKEDMKEHYLRLKHGVSVSVSVFCPFCGHGITLYTYTDERKDER